MTYIFWLWLDGKFSSIDCIYLYILNSLLTMTYSYYSCKGNINRWWTFEIKLSNSYAEHRTFLPVACSGGNSLAVVKCQTLYFHNYFSYRRVDGLVVSYHSNTYSFTCSRVWTCKPLDQYLTWVHALPFLFVDKICLLSLLYFDMRFFNEIQEKILCHPRVQVR